MLDTWKIVPADFAQFTAGAYAACEEFGMNGETIYVLGNPRDGSMIAMMVIQSGEPLIIWEADGDR